jgi:6-phosphogluconate dehydrogenase|uniref:6-phosphogluconate dehydrogenase, decarboxylating n=1 Tax=Attheya septentrionalis TaxID=420275 RepID=A0A7S2XQR7_9STRA|mmetsp:Transcript_21507/g.38905  ORF Transcript_21507/g.38905 Transcript_21507/m.38905 type:complete len:494 (+) Transcript_21507:103-1584(+)|eukprot:CAMPEP_0198304188 /NCGR_PEP_ID=MMETSP1449-20131203/57269_1 /TAXON_ID=420275 /ORGANISM="Attheya septentrionalis, Strain CCMP2084" /LENGTH=493 /DNA_ID=CAMNT_0044006703 /DNA_START=94 /DNA_END=1575 /DNA_ORIENTATION=-
MTDELCDVGLYGLAIMGQNFALNMASHGFKVCVSNRSPSKVDLTVNRAKAEGDLPLIGEKDPKDFIAKLSKPRKVVLLVMAGKPVDDTIDMLSELMEEGDVIIDGGNEWYPNSIRRSETLKSKGIMFIGMGISGGEEGARNGPSLMPGGPREAFDLIEPILTKCAAQVSDGACTGYLGPIGSGNYVKMVHNGIEYGDMQLIAEVYDVLRKIVGMTNDQMAATFDKWNKGDLESYLIEITAKILGKKDDLSDGYVVDKILDKTGSKGTGRWTVQEAAEVSVAAPTIAASLDTRYLSARKVEREKASTVLEGPPSPPSVEMDQIINDLEAALYAAKVCSYAQGLGIIQAASKSKGWNVNLSECARLWKGGCIIRAKLLDKIQAALATDADLVNLMVDPGFAAELNERQMSLRRIVTLCISHGIACPALSATLTYYDSYRRESMPANLTQGQRDFFGGHTFERIDREGPHHTLWDDSHKDIGDITQRTAGEKATKE